MSFISQSLDLFRYILKEVKFYPLFFFKGYLQSFWELIVHFLKCNEKSWKFVTGSTRTRGVHSRNYSITDIFFMGNYKSLSLSKLQKFTSLFLVFRDTYELLFSTVESPCTCLLFRKVSNCFVLFWRRSKFYPLFFSASCSAME